MLRINRLKVLVDFVFCHIVSLLKKAGRCGIACGEYTLAWDKVNKALYKSGLSKAEAENIQRELLQRQSIIRNERRKRKQQE